MWAALALLSLLLAAISSRFHPSVIPFFLGFVNYLCRILALVVFLRVILSWFMVSPYNPLIILLNDVVEPILSPLRRVVPRLGMFDITPLIAIAILYVIPLMFNVILS